MTGFRHCVIIFVVLKITPVQIIVLSTLRAIVLGFIHSGLALQETA